MYGTAAEEVRAQAGGARGSWPAATARGNIASCYKAYMPLSSGFKPDSLSYGHYNSPILHLTSRGHAQHGYKRPPSDKEASH